jgi:TPR repeat protein
MGEGIQDYVEARRWYEKAAIAGVPVAMNNIGSLYRDGKGVQDYAEARRWFSCHRSNSLAMANIGYLYDRGLGLRGTMLKQNAGTKKLPPQAT